MRVPGSDTCTCCFFGSEESDFRILLYTHSIVCISEDRYWSPAFSDASPPSSYAFINNK